jgi:hypothetical protein
MPPRPQLLNQLIAQARQRAQQLRDTAVRRATAPTFTRASGRPPVTPRAEHRGNDASGARFFTLNYSRLGGDDVLR